MQKDSNIGLDQIVCNSPSTSEVAGIWLDNNDPENSFSQNKLEREILANNHSGESHKVQYYYGCYVPLQYPLLLPHGDTGWHRGIQRIVNPNRQCCFSVDTIIDPCTITTAAELFHKETKGMNLSNSPSFIEIPNYVDPISQSSVLEFHNFKSSTKKDKSLL